VNHSALAYDGKDHRMYITHDYDSFLDFAPSPYTKCCHRGDVTFISTADVMSGGGGTLPQTGINVAIGRGSDGLQHNSYTLFYEVAPDPNGSTTITNVGPPLGPDTLLGPAQIMFESYLDSNVPYPGSYAQVSINAFPNWHPGEHGPGQYYPVQIPTIASIQAYRLLVMLRSSLWRRLGLRVSQDSQITVPFILSGKAVVSLPIALMRTETQTTHQ
jgi:hypothetical protein